MDDTQALLREREEQGLRWFLSALTVATLGWALGGLVFITADTGKAFVFGSGLATVGVLALLLRALNRGKSLTAVGYLTVGSPSR